MSFTPRSIPTDRPWQQGGEEPVSFGSWLRRQREVREIGLREIADASKISLRYLEAFEQDRFDVLPAPVFARGFLREYAKYVGLDPDEVVNHFLGAQQALEPDDDEEETPSSSSRSSWLVNLLLVLAALVVIVLVALLAFHAERRREGRAEPPRAALARPESRGAGGSGEPSGSGEPARTSPAEPSPVVPAAAPGSLVEDAGEPVEDGSGAPAAAPAVPLTVTLDFLADCWVEIVVDGRRSIRQEVPAGESMRLEAEERVVLTLGNAGGVGVRVNGHPYDLGRRDGEVVRGVTIDLDTARLLAEGT